MIKSEVRWFHEDFKILDKYHEKITATRSLFVTSFPNAFVTSTYVSSSGYAVIDLHERFGVQGDVKPIIVLHDTLPPPDIITKDVSSYELTHCYDLAVLLYRSVEQLLPVPLPHEDTFTINHVHESLRGDNGEFRVIIFLV